MEVNIFFYKIALIFTKLDLVSGDSLRLNNPSILVNPVMGSKQNNI